MLYIKIVKFWYDNRVAIQFSKCRKKEYLSAFRYGLSNFFHIILFLKQFCKSFGIFSVKCTMHMRLSARACCIFSNLSIKLPAFSSSCCAKVWFGAIKFDAQRRGFFVPCRCILLRNGQSTKTIRLSYRIWWHDRNAPDLQRFDWHCPNLKV